MGYPYLPYNFKIKKKDMNIMIGNAEIGIRVNEEPVTSGAIGNK
jgi:hypothetical protein